MFAVLVMTVGCRENSRQAAHAPAATAADAAAACAQFTREGLKLHARTIGELEAAAGRPLARRVEVEPNRHVADARDSIIALEYDGMTVQVRKPGPGGEMFEHVTVSKRKWLNFPYFQPGVSEKNVIAVLGEPATREPNRLIYNCGGGEVDNPVVFDTRDGTVDRIIFQYYVD